MPVSLAFLLTLFLQLLVAPAGIHAQNCFSSQGCADYSNYGINSTVAATLEYDNIVTGAGQTIARDVNGELKIFGRYTALDGIRNLLSPMPINNIMFPGLTGTPLKAGIGSFGSDAQVILLTTDGLWAWGVLNSAVSSSSTVAPNRKFSKIPLGLPAGVTPADVKMMFVTYKSIAITTCAGNVHVLTNSNNSGNAVARGDGSTGTPAGWNTTWSTVQKTDGSPLTNVVATRGGWGMFYALTGAGELYTWGSDTYLGTGTTETAVQNRSRATLMTLPPADPGDGPIKMIGLTADDFIAPTYYVLYQSGKLFAMGAGSARARGYYTLTNGSWNVPEYPSAGNPNAPGPLMTDIKWISPNETDPAYPSINVINSAGRLYNFGEEVYGNLGRDAGDANRYPGQSPTLTGTDIRAVESSGYNTVVITNCQPNFGIAGDNFDGSRGSGIASTIIDDDFTFNTAGIKVCGASNTDMPEINILGAPSINDVGEYCNGTTVELGLSPAGGTLAIRSGTANLNTTDNTISFTTAGLVTIGYTVNVSGCGPVEVIRVFNVNGGCTPNITLTGSVWRDDGNAVINGGEPNLANNMWANLTGPAGEVISSVRVTTSGANLGTYQFLVSKAIINEIGAGNYSIVLTNAGKRQGTILTAADVPANGYGYTGTNNNGTADAANRTGKLNVGDLMAAADNSTLPNLSFGISNDPLVLPVSFGAITAKIIGGQLTVNWSTLKETNNDRFEIEASVDGENFTTIGTVDSKATNGNSDRDLEYQFERNATDSNSLLLSLGVLALGAIGLGATRKFRVLFGLLLLLGVSGFIVSCKNQIHNLWKMANCLFVLHK
ncbi:hypothetical protein [Niabella hibiscisoli]|uniref:hypothetical protein n=1 Tax=Niabella hibiscisoli TaxID=1825928 RepID=UPI001F0D5CAF|nr:hypothetical protein [Niabella hibiscisoli]MCH5720376.1 hypothetical protein [Niabella hibiscisoli]